MIFLHTLGTAYIDGGDVRVTPAYSRKFALLLRLSGDGDLSVPRSELDELIFPDFSPRNASHSMRDLVYRLRVDGFPIEAAADAVALTAGSAHTDYGEIMRRDRLTTADLAAVTAGFLPGYDPERMESFSEWLGAYRARTLMALSRTLAKQIATVRSIGDWSMTEQTARACLTLDATNEEATLALAEMLALGGGKMQAVALLDEYMRSVGRATPDLRVPAAVLRRRISERLPTHVRSSKAMPFVGRDREMLLLRDRFMDMKEGRGQCVVISGEPGIGKSRLALEFSNLAILEGAYVERASAQPHDVYRPMAAIADLVPGLLGLPGALGCAPESLQALGRLTSRGERELDYRLDDAQASEALYFSITRAVADLMDSLSGERPLVLVIEDCHWLDDVSIRILGQIAAARGAHRIMILLTTRDRAVLQILPPHVDCLSEIEMTRLDDAAVDRLIAAESDLRDAMSDDAMRNWLLTTSAGNPLFFQSLVVHYVETGERFGVPSALRSLLDQRIARLANDAALALQMCVLLGKYAKLERIEAAVQLPRNRLLGAVAELDRARLIDVNGVLVCPTHALIADAAVHRFSAIENRVAHRYVAEVLEGLSANNDTPSVVWDCAEHWVSAADHERAVAALRRCAALSLEVGRPRGAAEAFLRAAELVSSQEEREELARSAALAADVAGEALPVLRALELLDRERLKEQHDDLEFVGLSAETRLYRGDGNSARQLLDCVQSETASPEHRVRAAIMLLKQSDVIGKTTFAERALEALPESVLARSDDLSRAELKLIASSILARHDEAAEAAGEMLNVASRATSGTRARFELNAALAMWRAGLADRAIQTAIKANQDANEGGLHRTLLSTALMLTDFYADLCEDEEALVWLSRAKGTVSHAPELIDEAALPIMEIDARISFGDLPAARAAYDAARARSVFAMSELTARWGRVFEVMLSDRPESLIGEIDELLDCNRRTGPLTGLPDAEIAAACTVLIAARRTDEARDLLDSYAINRQSRAPISRSLQGVRRRIASTIAASFSELAIESQVNAELS